MLYEVYGRPKLVSDFTGHLYNISVTHEYLGDGKYLMVLVWEDEPNQIFFKVVTLEQAGKQEDEMKLVREWLDHIEYDPGYIEDEEDENGEEVPATIRRDYTEIVLKQWRGYPDTSKVTLKAL